MKKIYYAALLFFCLSRFVLSAQPTTEWEATLDYLCLSATQDDFGNTFYFSKTGQLSKVDPSGNTLWSHPIVDMIPAMAIYDLKDHAYKKLLATDHVGDVVLAMMYRDDPFSTTYYCKIIKVSKDGDVLWLKSFAPPSNLYGRGEATGVVIDDDNNVIVTAKEYGGGAGVYFVSYNENGDLNWSVKHNIGYVNDLTIDSNGIYASGWNGGSSASAIRLSMTGALVWFKTFKADGWVKSIGHEVKTDPDGNVFISGYSHDATDPVTGFASQYAYFVAKYNSAGTLLWSHDVDNSPLPTFTNIWAHLEVDALGNSYMAGFVSIIANDWDVGIWKFDPEGNQHVNTHFNNWDYDMPYGIVADDAENFYITGATNRVSPLTWNYVTIKYDMTGSFVWSKFYVGGSDKANFLFKQPNSVYVTAGIHNADLTTDGKLLKYSDPDSSPFTIYTLDHHGTRNTEIVVPIQTNKFKDIVGGQFSISWDPSVATFVGVESFGLNGIDVTSFGITNVSNGELTISWSDPNLIPQNLEDSSTVAAIRFILTGDYGDKTDIAVSGNPLPIEIINANFELVDPLTIAGELEIDSTLTTSGKVRYANGEAIMNATVSLNSIPPVNANTDAMGSYSLVAPAGTNYEVRGSKVNDPDPLNGIDVQDIASIRRHVLKLEALSGPYAIIAADVNESASISTLDIVFIQALILGVNTNLPNNIQWTFIPADYIFSNPSNPFPYPNSVSLVHVDGNILQDFVGVKFGDVNDSRDNTQQGRQGVSAEVTFVIDNEIIAHDNLIEVPVKTRGFENIAAYQFTVEWNKEKLEYVGVENAALEGRFGSNRTNDGILTTLWDDLTGKSKTLSANDNLFVLRFRKIEETAGNNDVTITGNATRSVVYNKSLQAVSHRVEWNDDEKLFSEFELYPNYPNAFVKQTLISFSLPERGNVKLEITDELGRVVKHIQDNYPAGKNSIEWAGSNRDGAEVGAGVYFLVARYGVYRQVIKMIKIN